MILEEIIPSEALHIDPNEDFSFGLKFRDVLEFLQNNPESPNGKADNQESALLGERNQSNLVSALAEAAVVGRINEVLKQHDVITLPKGLGVREAEPFFHASYGLRTGEELWNHIRVNRRVAVGLMKARSQIARVVWRCSSAEAPFQKEVERLNEVIGHLREKFEATWLPDWQSEMGVHQRLVDSVNQFHQFRQQEKPTRKSMAVPLQTFSDFEEQEILRKVYSSFCDVCTFSRGVVEGLRRRSVNGETFQIWWSKALSMLQTDGAEHKTSVGGGGSGVSRGALLKKKHHEDTFWLFSRLYSRSDAVDKLVECEGIEKYLRIVDEDRRLQALLKSMIYERLQVNNKPQEEIKKPSHQDSMNSLEFPPSGNTISTDELFSNLTESDHLEEIKNRYLENLNGKKTEAYAPKETRDSSDSSTRAGQVSTARAESQLDERKKDWISEKAITRKSAVVARQSANALRRSTLRTGERDSRRRTTSVVIRSRNKSEFNRRIDQTRKTFPRPYSITRTNDSVYEADRKSLLPTEDLLKGMILRLPHEYAECRPERFSQHQDINSPLTESDLVRKTLRLSTTRFPLMVRTLLRKNSVVLSAKAELLPRVRGINDMIRNRPGLSDTDLVTFREKERLEGLREESDNYLLKCLIPDFAVGGFSRRLSEARRSVASREVMEAYGAQTVLMLPADSVGQATNILDLANQVLISSGTHSNELFELVFESLKPDPVWIQERNEHVLGVSLFRLAHSLLKHRNTPGHCVRFKLLSVLCSANYNPVLRKQLRITARIPNGWLDQSLRTFNSCYVSCRTEAVLIVVYTLRKEKILRELMLAPHFESELGDITLSLLRAADVFAENFCECFMALAHLFQCVRNRILVQVVLDHFSSFQSAQLAAAWPLLLVFAFKYWSRVTIMQMHFNTSRLSSVLNEALSNPVSRRNARAAAEAIETAFSLKLATFTRWPQIPAVDDESDSETPDIIDGN